jgi:hypothetical protein
MRRIAYGRVISRREWRCGPTRRWPAVILPVKWGKNGRPCGLWFRVGEHAAYVTMVPR